MRRRVLFRQRDLVHRLRRWHIQFPDGPVHMPAMHSWLLRHNDSGNFFFKLLVLPDWHLPDSVWRYVVHELHRWIL